MKKFIREYLDLIAYATLGIALVISSFYLLINYYHSEEVSKTLNITEGDVYYRNYKTKLENIKNNLDKFAKTNSDVLAYRGMYTKLSTCYRSLNSEGTFSSLEVNKKYKSVDIFNLGTTFQSKALNDCWAINLSYLTDEELLPEEFKEIAPFIKTNVDFMTNQVSTALAELENNSSYFMTTNITSLTVRNYLNADYVTIASSYNSFADILLNLSEIINESEGAL